MQVVIADFGKDYQLIDTGNFRKLERFGDYVISRPEPQAVWLPALSEDDWTKKASTIFIKGTQSAVAGEKGEWKSKPEMPEQWYVVYKNKELNFRLRLGLTAFKHVGIFPEQCDNWNYIYNAVQQHSSGCPRILNLFAYTGGASLAAASAGAEVVHVDSVKPVLSWAKQNMEASSLKNISWVHEDALKFVARESRRNNKYHGIILDPPAYGRGPKGEKWQLEDNIQQMMKHCSEILDESQGSFVVLNLYSMGFAALIADNLLKSFFGTKDIEYGEIAFRDDFQRLLPLGVFARFKIT